MVFEEKTVESEIIYKGAILNLRRDKVTVATGTAYREIIEHNGASAIAAVNNDGKMIMVKQFRKPAEKILLEVPAGKIDGSESAEISAKRELKEETGYEARTWISLGEMYPSVGYSEEIIHLYLAMDLIPGETSFDDDESIDVYEYDLAELKKMVMNNEIPDSKTQLLILKTAEYLGKN